MSTVLLLGASFLLLTAVLLLTIGKKTGLLICAFLSLVVVAVLGALLTVKPPYRAEEVTEHTTLTKSAFYLTGEDGAVQLAAWRPWRWQRWVYLPEIITTEYTVGVTGPAAQLPQITYRCAFRIYPAAAEREQDAVELAEDVAQKVESLLREFNNYRSNEFSQYYNAQDELQQQMFRKLVESSIGSRLPKGVAIEDATFDVG